VISLNLVLAGLRLGLKNRQVGEKWVSDDYSYLCKGLTVLKKSGIFTQFYQKISNNLILTITIKIG
jgi:hypothetical protein